MKRICFFLILIILLASVPAWNAVDTKDSAAVTTSATFDGETGIDTADGQTIKAASTFCAGTELFCEDFEGTDTAWDTAFQQEDCTPDSTGDYCDDYTGQGPDSTEAAAIWGDYDEAYFYEPLASLNQSEITGVLAWKTPANITGVINLPVAFSTDGGTIQMNMYYYSTTGNVVINQPSDNSSAACSISTSTWYYVKYYVKEETGGDNGIHKMTLDNNSDFSSPVCTITDTGLNNQGECDFDHYRMRGPHASQLSVFDNTKVVAGDSYATITTGY